MSWLMLMWMMTETSRGGPEPSLEERVAHLERLWVANPVTQTQLEKTKETLATAHEKARLAEEARWNQLEARLNAADARDTEMRARLNQLDFWKTSTWSGLGLSLVVVITLFCKLWTSTTKMVDKKVAETVDAEIGLIKQMVRAADLDRIIRSQERLKVLCLEGSRLKATLHGFHFDRVAEVMLPEGLTDNILAAIDPADHDLIVFDNLDETTINAYLAVRPDAICLAYTTDGRRLNVDPLRVTHANAPMTLLARLMEAARYRRTLPVSLS